MSAEVNAEAFAIEADGDKRVTATERTYLGIRHQILRGDLPSGTHLGEAYLAEQAGVSRTPIREALRRLHSEGLVEFRPNRGAVVIDLDPEDLDELYSLRALLEAHAAQLAATRITEHDVELLASFAGKMERYDLEESPDQVEVVSNLNRSFHQTIVSAAGNQRLGLVLNTLVQAPLVQRTFLLYRNDDYRRSCAAHRELLQALTEGDATWAHAVMQGHILAARAVLRRHHKGGAVAETGSR